jgi:hypothetical protein
MQSLNSDVNDARVRRSKLSLWLILAVCAAPIIGSYTAYYFWRPTGHVNYGELIAPRTLPDDALWMLDGTPFRWKDVRGAWVLLTADRAGCDEGCRNKLVYTRQVRVAQGKETRRVERVWLVTDAGAPDPRLRAEHPGLRIVRANPSETIKILPPNTSAAERIYVIDPLGKLMMRFPADPDPRRMLKDLSRLLRHSQWK